MSDSVPGVVSTSDNALYCPLGFFGFVLVFLFFKLVAVLLNSSFLPQRNMSLGAGEIPI